jgi:uncharacterized protein YciI
MKGTLWIFLSFLIFCGCDRKPSGQSEIQAAQKSMESVYDSVLAQQLGADDYGMKMYVMAFLKAGPKRDQDSATVARIQREHLDNIFRLADEGKLIVAGPFLDEGDLKGVFVFDVRTVGEAKALVETDPAVIAGRLSMELHPWYGSAALLQINDLHKKVQKEKI